MAGPAAADCRLALALGFDVSRSIDARDYEIQRDGLIAALQAPEIRDAFLAPPDHVTFALYEWSGQHDQRVIVPWTRVIGPADLDRIVAIVLAHQRGPERQATALGRALAFGRGVLAEAEPCATRTLDISGDGQNNDGPSPGRTYETVDFEGVTVNGLAIGDHERGIFDYYEREVISGPGAFVIASPVQSDFPRAIRRKLEKELSVRLLGSLPEAGRGG
ncbi:MAG: DUF1194 domain-containing protein [Paracoccaceae bacterium]